MVVVGEIVYSLVHHMSMKIVSINNDFHLRDESSMTVYYLGPYDDSTMKDTNGYSERDEFIAKEDFPERLGTKAEYEKVEAEYG